jgi:hypothetical protein
MRSPNNKSFVGLVRRWMPVDKPAQFPVLAIKEVSTDFFFQGVDANAEEEGRGEESMEESGGISDQIRQRMMSWVSTYCEGLESRAGVSLTMTVTGTAPPPNPGLYHPATIAPAEKPGQARAAREKRPPPHEEGRAWSVAQIAWKQGWGLSTAYREIDKWRVIQHGHPDGHYDEGGVWRRPKLSKGLSEKEAERFFASYEKLVPKPKKRRARKPKPKP